MWVLWLFPWSHSLYSYTEHYCGIVTIYDVRSSHIVSIRAGLKSRLIWDWSAVIHTFPASRTVVHTISARRSSLYVYILRSIYVQNGKIPRTCSRISVHCYQRSYDTCRGANVWPLTRSESAKNSWKLEKVDKTRCTWPFQAENRYDVTLANRRAPGVWFVLGFRTYQVHLFWAKTLYFYS